MRYGKGNLCFEAEDGSALVITLLFLTILAVLSSSLVFVAQSEMKSSSAYRYTQQASYVANAGVQKAIQWFNKSYSPYTPSSTYTITTLPVEFSGQPVMLAGQTGSASVYPSSTVATAFAAQFRNQSIQANANNSGVYELNARLLKYTPVTFIDPTTFAATPSAVERWRISAVGYWGSTTNPMGAAQTTAIIENSGNPLFDRALWGIDGVSLGGTVLIDSYDSTLGPYGGTNVGNGGSIGTNASVSTNGSVTVKGDLIYGPTGSFTHVGGVTVTGQIMQESEPRVFPPLPNFTVGTVNYSYGSHDTATLGPGQYGTISLGGQAHLTFTGGTYYIDQLTITAQADITVSAETILYVKSALSLGGGLL
jgi:hypothetical protein